MRAQKNDANSRTEECLPCGVNSVSGSESSSFELWEPAWKVW